MVKNLPAKAGNTASTPGLRRSPGGGNGNSLQYSCLGNSSQRNLVGYSPRGCRVRHTHTDYTNENHSKKKKNVSEHNCCKPSSDLYLLSK